MEIIKKYKNSSLLATSNKKEYFALYLKRRVRIYNSKNEKIYELKIDYPTYGCFSMDDQYLYVFYNSHHIVEIDFKKNIVKKILELVDNSIMIKMMYANNNELEIIYSYFESEGPYYKLVNWKKDQVEEVILTQKLYIDNLIRTSKGIYLTVLDRGGKEQNPKTRIAMIKDNNIIDFEIFSNLFKKLKYCEFMDFTISSTTEGISIRKNGDIIYKESEKDRNYQVNFSINEESRLLVFEIKEEVKVMSLDNLKVVDLYEVFGKIAERDPDSFEVIRVYEDKVPVLKLEFLGKGKKIIFAVNNDLFVAQFNG